MKRMVALLAAAAVVVSLSLLPPPTRAQDSLEGIAYQDSREGGIRRSLNAISGQYIVVFNDEVAADDVANATESLASYGDVEVTFTYEHALRGFAASMSEKTAQALSEDPRVAYVEEDSEVEGASVQNPAPPGLDRIDQRDLPLDGKYTYFNSGSGVNVYIIDSGIRTTHTQFGGRASVAYDGVNDGQNGQDCFGHGTHVAGIVGGSTYGVAKNVQLKAVRILNCSNSGPVSQVVAGIDWVAGNHTTPSAALLSISTTGSLTLDNAVIALVASGVTAVVAAGNNNLNAGIRSPARVPEAITVGAVDQFDTRAVISNFGSVLDIFAPGVNIESADWASDTATLQRTGTSMAAAFTAGVVARYLSGNPSDTPADVALALTGSATAGHVINPGAGSPNLLLYQPQSKLAFEHYTSRDSQIFVMNSDGSGVTQLTNYSDYNLLWSPDGTKISFISQRDGNEEIYVMNADGTGQTRLTNNAARDAEQTWSADGTKLAFVSERDGNSEIYVVNVSGGAQTRLTNTAASERWPAWSPGGSKIAFINSGGGGKVWTMNTDGTGQTQLTTGASYDYNPKWSPDGTKIAYTSNGNGYQIGVINADGTNQHNATSGTAWWSQFPVWAPDSTRIAFTSHCPYQCSPAVYNDEIFTVNADGTNLTRLTTNDVGEGDHGWSPDGTKIIFSTYVNNSREIYVMNSDGSGQTNLSNYPAAAEGGAMISPDGNKIAFLSDRNSLGNEIFSMRADGTGRKMLTDSGLEDYAPVWSPDGTRIAYSAAPMYAPHDIYVMKPDGTSQTRLTNNPANDYGPVWSPDMTKLAFTSDRDGNYEIYTMNADGTAQTRLTNNSAQDYGGAWSPAGGKIAFMSHRDGNWEVYSVNPDGTGLANLTNSADDEWGFSWSPDGSKIAFSRYVNGSVYNIFTMNADGTNKVNLTPTSTGDYGPVWSPDGTKIAFNYYGGPSGEEIYVMNANGTGRTQITNNVGDDFGPAWSPDGSKITTQSESPDGTFEIYIMNSDGTGRTRLTFNVLNGPMPAAWQPL